MKIRVQDGQLTQRHDIGREMEYAKVPKDRTKLEHVDDRMVKTIAWRVTGGWKEE
jgi:hypothetical protein